MTPDPWESIEKEYPVGSVIEGEVSRITNFGAFIRLPIGVEGLVHISELSDQNVDKVEDVLKLGDKEQFRVINVNRNERRLGLSLRQPREDKKVEVPPVDAAKAAEKKARVAKAPKVEQPSVAKPKSLLQIELEKHVARQQEAAMADVKPEETEQTKE